MTRSFVWNKIKGLANQRNLFEIKSKVLAKTKHDKILLRLFLDKIWARSYRPFQDLVRCWQDAQSVHRTLSPYWLIISTSIMLILIKCQYLLTKYCLTNILMNYYRRFKRTIMCISQMNKCWSFSNVTTHFIVNKWNIKGTSWVT